MRSVTSRAWAEPFRWSHSTLSGRRRTLTSQSVHAGSDITKTNERHGASRIALAITAQNTSITAKRYAHSSTVSGVRSDAPTSSHASVKPATFAAPPKTPTSSFSAKYTPMLGAADEHAYERHCSAKKPRKARRRPKRSLSAPPSSEPAAMPAMSTDGPSESIHVPSQ